MSKSARPPASFSNFLLHFLGEDRGVLTDSMVEVCCWPFFDTERKGHTRIAQELVGFKDFSHPLLS